MVEIVHEFSLYETDIELNEEVRKIIIEDSFTL